MNVYTLSLAFLCLALAAQLLASATALEQWLHRAQTSARRRLWLSLTLAALIASLHHAYSLELALRTSLYDFRQATLAMLGSLLTAYAINLLRKS